MKDIFDKIKEWSVQSFLDCCILARFYTSSTCNNLFIDWDVIIYLLVRLIKGPFGTASVGST